MAGAAGARQRLRIGVNIAARPTPDPVAEARHAEELGFDLLTLHPDHPSATGTPGTDPSLELWTLLTWVAARTSSIALAPCVLTLPFRHPAVIAKMAATLSDLSAGRLVLAMGAGSLDPSTRAFGLTTATPSAKLVVVEEAIHVIRALWADDRGVSYAGQHYSLAAARLEPTPGHVPPIWLGAHHPRMLRLAGRTADGWLPTLHYLVRYLHKPPETAYAMLEEVRRGLDEAGRDPAGFTFGLNVPVRVEEGAVAEPGEVAGSPDQVTEELARFVQGGFTLLNVWPVGNQAEQRQRLAAEILPGVRAIHPGA